MSPQMDPFDIVSTLLIVVSAYLVDPNIALLHLHSPKPHGGQKISPAQAIPVFTVNLLPPSYAGLVATALLATFISSADTGD
jgi:hypothetical protein